LPQVLAGLGLVSLISAGCLLWLERLQPFFFAVAIASLVWQVWAVWRRAPFLRTRSVKVVLASSLLLNALVIGTWVFLLIRYR
jgi:hypothetical protein